MFTDTDVLHMKPYGFDLSVHEDVKEHAEAIYGAVSEGSMPPKADGGPWSKDQCDKFQQWMDDGCPP